MPRKPKSPTVMPTRDELMARYTRAIHGVQKAVVYERSIHNPGGEDACSPVSLRVGVNSALIGESAIANFLIKEGFMSTEAYYTALAEAAEAELAHYEKKFTPVKFG